MPSVDATSPRSRVHDHDADPPPAPAAPRRAPPAPRADATIDANVAAAAANANATATPAFNDRILYFGANATSRAAEVGALGPNVEVLTTSASSVVTFGRASYDLSTAAGVLHFADAVGTTPEERVKLATLIGRLAEGDRDELARIAVAWAPGERGGSIPSRLVLSGHSGGYSLFGDNNDGYVVYEHLKELATIMPHAAAQIEDIHFASCNSEGKVQDSTSWKTVFPNLKTMWGYRGTSPLAPAGDLHAWEVATRGRTATLGEGLMRSHGNTTAWSVHGGIANEGASLAERRQGVADADTRFASYLSGDRPIPNPHDPTANGDYNAFQALAAAPEATPAEKEMATTQAQQMLRLRFWDQSVRGAIATHYGAQINAVLEAEGMPGVDFRTLSRRDALGVIEQYREKHGSLGPIMTGIVRLSPATIPESWC